MNTSYRASIAAFFGVLPFLLIAPAAAEDTALLPRPGEILIQAYVDGITELHVTTTGIYWVNGMYAKPGRHDGNWPTFINGQQWFPQWQKPNAARGVDWSAPFPIKVQTLDLDLELIAVGTERDAPGIEPRSPITVARHDEELIVTIPDPEFGPRWYTFALVAAKK